MSRTKKLLAPEKIKRDFVSLTAKWRLATNIHDLSGSDSEIAALKALSFSVFLDALK